MIDTGDGSILVVNHAVGGPTYDDVDQLDDRSNLAELVASSQSARIDELTSWMWQTGIVGIRQYTINSPNDPRRRFAEPYSAINIHDHPNFHRICGMAELGAVANGMYVRTRHNDYAHMRPVRGEFLEREYVEPPEVPSWVLAKPTGLAPNGDLDLDGDTQARWMSRVLTDSPEACRADLAYLEVWLEEIIDLGDGPTDAAVSTRHADLYSTSLDEHEKNESIRAAGTKNPGENIAFRPVGILVERGGPGQPIRAKTYAVNYRINTVPIGTLEAVGANPTPPHILIGTSNSHDHILDRQLTAAEYADLKSGAVTHIDLGSTDIGHDHTYRITWSGTALDGHDLNPNHQHSVIILQGFSGVAPYDEAKATAQTIDPTNRFSLAYDLQALDRYGTLHAVASSRSARYHWADLSAAMELIPGMDGAGATLTEEHTFNGVTFRYDAVDDPTDDPENPSLNSAYYNRQAKAISADASGRRIQHRGFNDPQLWVAQTSHPEVAGGWSYAIPLEILIRTPVESWNPAGISVNETTGVLPGGAAGTETDPWPEANARHWWFTPAALAAAATGADPADTANGTNWVLGSDGNAYECVASGMWIFNPALGNARTRIPIYKIAQEGSREAVDIYLLRKMLKPLLADVINGTATVVDLEWLDLY